MRAPDQTLLGNIRGTYRLHAGKRVFRTDHELVGLRKQGPALEPIPGFAKRARERDLDIALLQELGNFRPGAAHEAQLQARKRTYELGYE